MANITQIIEAYITTKTKLTEVKKHAAELKKTERELIREIKTYLNAREQTELKIDDRTVISIRVQNKKILRSKNDHRAYVENLLLDLGVAHPEEIIDQIFDKTGDVVQEQRLILSKDK
jgi:hypothetical protein